MKFNTCYSYTDRKKAFTDKSGAKLVIPGQAYSIKDSINRLRAGLPLNIIKSGFNPDGFPVPNDLTDVDAFRALVKAKQAEIEKKLQDIEAQRSEPASDKSEK